MKPAANHNIYICSIGLPATAGNEAGKNIPVKREAGDRKEFRRYPRSCEAPNMEVSLPATPLQQCGKVAEKSQARRPAGAL